MASRVNKVIGIEIVDSAVRDAQVNAEKNGIKNVEYICNKAETVMKSLIGRPVAGCSRTVAIVDPPRGGLHPKVLVPMLYCNVMDRLVYVSCNPKTLADNAIDLCRADKGAKITFYPVKAVAVDMFPHSSHCEMVMLFKRYFHTKKDPNGDSNSNNNNNGEKKESKPAAVEEESKPAAVE